MIAAPRVKCLLPWYGSNRSCAAAVGKALSGCSFVAIPFAGSLAEVLHLDARTIAANDLHRRQMNLARVVKLDADDLRLLLDGLPFHPDTLAEAQQRCASDDATPFFPAGDVGAAAAWFVAGWMARNSGPTGAGTAKELAGNLSVRFDAGGGDSVTRWRNAADSLAAWQAAMQRCQFTTMDAFDFLDRQHDRPGHGVYADPPFPDAGDAYAHGLGENGQQRLAEVLASFEHARVVVRFHDHPLVRDLYPADHWHWTFPAGGRTQNNRKPPEVLLIRRNAHAPEGDHDSSRRGHQSRRGDRGSFLTLP